MEASVAQGEGAAPAAEQGTQETSNGGLDLTPVLERFDGLTPRFEKLEQSVSQLLGGDDTDDDPDAGFDFESLYGDPEEDPEAAQAARLNPEALQALLDQRVQQALDAHVNPLVDQVRSIQVGLDAEQLVARYPDLAKAEVSGPVVARAKELAEKAGKPEMADNMEFIEVIYQAEMAKRYAAGEVPVGAEKGFELERASGAGPAQAEQPNYVERLQQRQAAGAWPPRF
jgi:hypothetical protein